MRRTLHCPMRAKALVNTPLLGLPPNRTRCVNPMVVREGRSSDLVRTLRTNSALSDLYQGTAADSKSIGSRTLSLNRTDTLANLISTHHTCRPTRTVTSATYILLCAVNPVTYRSSSPYAIRSTGEDSGLPRTSQIHCSGFRKLIQKIPALTHRDDFWYSDKLLVLRPLAAPNSQPASSQSMPCRQPKQTTAITAIW